MCIYCQQRPPMAPLLIILHTVETEITKRRESRDNDLIGMECMDKGDIWLPQKIVPMSVKIPGSEADVFHHRGPINT